MKTPTRISKEVEIGEASKGWALMSKQMHDIKNKKLNSVHRVFDSSLGVYSKPMNHKEW